MRLAYYAGASTAAACGCLLKAFHQRPNFYSATVYLSQSNACLLIITNLLLVLACSFLFGLQRLLYGPLRPIEIEQLSEKAWYAVLDTLLAMPSLREDVGGWLLTMFVLLLAGKVWGWIGEGRVDILEQQPPANPRLFHARLATSLILSVAFDLWMLDYCIETVMADPRPGMMVIFTFEFAILSVFSMFTLARYSLALVDGSIQKRQLKQAIEERKKEIQAERAAARQNETATGDPAPASPPNEEPIEVDENEVDVPGWEEKRRYLFGLEVLTDFVKLMIYIVFFTVCITFNGLPMHIMRDVYMTFASFSKRVNDYVAYRKATSDMNTRYPDATTEEIRGDACIVCRESMIAWEQPAPQAPAQPVEGQQAPAAVPAAPVPATRRDEGLRAKKLPCGHILHLRCLKAWLERQQVCPTCRRPVITPDQPAAPGQPGQPGAPGQQPPVPGQAQRQARQGRARIFNLGPVRIGFLNGPDNNQVEQVIDQLRNGGQPALQDGQGAVPAHDPHQHGPNHLGLEVPYLPGAAAQQGRSHVPTHIQLLRLEQRLMQDAQNLGVEQQQLATLRMMEAELARLRAVHVPAQLPVGTATAAQRQQQQQFQMPFGQAMMMPFGQPYMVPPAALPPPRTLHGDVNQQVGTGSEQLPQGLVLPEGWTLMPLHAMNAGSGVPGVAPQPAQQQSSQAVAPPASAAAQQNGTNAAQSVGASNSSSQAPPSQTQNESAGPKDDDGSPLFVPTPTPTTNAAPAPNSNSAVTATTGVTAETQPHTQAQPPTQPASQAPWSSGDGWNFVGQNGDSSTNGPPHESAQAEQPANGAAPQEQQTYDGKGKAKAVEVEDAEDAGS